MGIAVVSLKNNTIKIANSNIWIVALYTLDELQINCGKYIGTYEFFHQDLYKILHMERENFCK
jgi:hypothetical protein